ncbi:MAG TPA: hypothetical protein VM935_07695, partial [Chitinophagaceae bacterium]|nr:hypothetical protein [Chitinophagaceae bacterium]
YNGRQEDQDKTGKTFNPTKKIDFVNCTIKNPIQLGADVADGEVIRVQNGTTAYQITKAGRVSIPPFHK